MKSRRLRFLSVLVLSLFLLSLVGQFLNVDLVPTVPLTKASPDPDTFGETSAGSTGAPIQNAIDATWFTCPKDGIGKSMSASIWVGSEGDKIKMAVYKRSDESLVGTTEEWVADSTGKQWVTKNFTTPKPTFQENVDYYLAVWGWGSSSDPQSYFFSETSRSVFKGIAYDSWPDPLDSSGTTDRRHSIYCTYTPSDTTNPTYTTITTNTTRAGRPCLFRVLWWDDVGLSGFIFGANNTGSWQNETWTSPWEEQTVGYADTEKTLNDTVGVEVQWRVWANDTSNNWNSTAIQSFTTTGSNRFVDPTLGNSLTGTLNFTQGSFYVTGVGTNFSGEVYPSGLGITIGYILIKGDGYDEWRSVSQVIDDTTLKLRSISSYSAFTSAKVNKNDGSAPELAVAHLTQLVEYRSVEAGDIIYLRRNTTHCRFRLDYSIRPQGNGVEDNPITVMGDDGTGWPDETELPKPIFDYYDGISLESKTYWVFKDFEFINHYEATGPVRVEYSSHITFENVDFHDNQRAKKAVVVRESEDILFKSCTFYENCNITGTGVNIKIYGPSTVQLENCALDTGEVPYPWGIIIDTAPSTLYIRDTTFGTTNPHTTWDIWSNTGAGNPSIAYVYNVTFTTGVNNVDVRDWIEIPPTYSNVGANITLAGNATKFHSYWQDAVGLSGFIFGTNNTGTWENETWADPWSGTPTSGWSNVTKTLNSTVGVKVTFQFWCNDTDDNWASTGTYFLTTSAGNIVIEVDQISVSTLRVNVATNITIHLHTRFNVNQSSCPSGTLYVNATGYSINGTGWASVPASSSVVTNKIYTVTGANVSGETDCQQIPPDVEIIWDRLELYDNGISTNRSDVGSTVTFWWKLRYDYDNVTFDVAKGSVNIGGQYASWNSIAERWNREVTLPSTPQNYSQAVTFTDSTYGLTAMTGTTNQSVIADKLSVTFSASKTAPSLGETVTISWQIKRQYDNSNVTSFTIDVARNGLLWKEGLTNSSISDSYLDAGTHTYDVHVSSVLDETYGLTSFDSNGISVSWISPIDGGVTKYRLTVTVVDESRVPQGNVKVSILENLVTVASKNTDSNGIVKFVLEPGTYLVMAETSGRLGTATVDLDKDKAVTVVLEEPPPPSKFDLLESAEDVVERVETFVSTHTLVFMLFGVAGLFSGVGMSAYGWSEDENGIKTVGVLLALLGAIIVFYAFLVV